MKPLDQEEIIAIFGDPRPLLQADGMVSSTWEKRILAWGVLPAPIPLNWDRNVVVRRFRCHRLLVARFEAAFTRIHADPDAWNTIDDWGGIYLWRMQRGSKVPSTHGWGISVDMDVVDNAMESAGRVHPHVTASMEAEGFIWGGRFSGKRRDPMHWEFANLQLLKPARAA